MSMEPAPPKSSVAADDEIEIGTVVGTFSFKGEVRLHLHNPSSDLLASAKTVVLVSPAGARSSARLSTRPGAGGRVIGRFDGVTDEAGATALRGFRVCIAKASLPALSPDEYYVWQLEGCAVELSGVRVGVVVGVQEAGPNDVLEIHTPAGDAHFVPVRKEFVLEVDVAARVVRLADGALDEEEA
jgi:16S rRNA processing protein RimM